SLLFASPRALSTPPQPPTSPPFPYTTLFRSPPSLLDRLDVPSQWSALIRRCLARDPAARFRDIVEAREALARGRRRGGRRVAFRSEEHTSELQSLTHIVCRLLLEKTKNTSHS